MGLNSDENTITNETISVIFQLDELWLLQSLVRHEVERQADWHYPPASLDLNDQIAQAILFCIENTIAEAPLLLSRGDCLVIDYRVSASMKDTNGKLLGQGILVKSFVARRNLLYGEQLSAHGPELSAGDVVAALALREPEESHEFDAYH